MVRKNGSVIAGKKMQGTCSKWQFFIYIMAQNNDVAAGRDSDKRTE